MTPQSLARTSAIIYADNFSSRKTETIKKKFVEAVFANNNNQPLTINDIAAFLLKEMELTFTDPEIEAIVDDRESFVLMQVDGNKFHDKYSLTAKRFLFLSEKSTENIDECIKQYLKEKSSDDDTKTNSLKELLESYLYLMMNSNIEAYNQVLGGKTNLNAESANGRVKSEDFSDEQIREINDFLSWPNSTKDKELFKLVSCCIEYAIVANNSNERTLHQSLQNKTLYIDNAFIYRAIGINGESRKNRTRSFIQKCTESGQKLKITKFSREEFFRTIDYNIRQLNNTTPFGRINPQLFRKYCYGDTIYQFYHNWRSNRFSYGFNSFKAYVISEYNDLVRSCGIEEDFRPPFNENEEIPEIERYSNEIEALKKRGHKNSHDTDARNMYWIEQARGGVDGKLIDTKFYFITPDQKLQLWDSGHSMNQPITLLPSQWLALLLKYTSRSSDDYKSFVSFLRLPHNESDMKPEELQEILAGISEVTEDLQKQSDFLDVYIEEEWRQIRTSLNSTSLREDARKFTKDKQERVFKEELDRKSQEMAMALDKERSLNKMQMAALEASFKQQIIEQEKQNQVVRLKMRIDFLNQSLNSSQIQLVDTTTRKNQADSELSRIVLRWKLIAAFLLIGLLTLWVWLLFRFGWEKMEIFTYILGVSFLMVSTLYFILFEKEFSLKRTINTIREKNKQWIYRKYNVTDTIIEECSFEIDALRTQLRENEALLKKATGK